MSVAQSSPQIDLDAAQLSNRWRLMFATELRATALELARGATSVTVEHYHEALPIAMSKVLHAVQADTCGVSPVDDLGSSENSI